MSRDDEDFDDERWPVSEKIDSICQYMPVLPNPGWVGACERCGDVLVLQVGEVNDEGVLVGWACQDVDELEHVNVPERWCGGRFIQLPDQPAALGAYMVGGHQAIKEILRTLRQPSRS